MPAKSSAFWDAVANFYQSVGYGMLVLVLPVVVWTLFISALLGWFGYRAKVRIGFSFMLSFILAFALIGCVAGSIAGASLETIVGAALAAILGLVSSLLTYLFGKETLRAWRPIIPLALIALLTSTLAGLVIGGSRRTQLLAAHQGDDDAKAFAQNVDQPAQRELGILLVRKCVEGKTYEQALEACEVPQDPPSH